MNPNAFRLLSIGIICCSLTTSSDAQLKLSAELKQGFEARWAETTYINSSSVSWNLVSSSGTLIIATRGSSGGGGTLQGFDKDTGEKLFHIGGWFEGAYKPESFEEIPNTPLFVLTNSERKEDQIVINMVTGKVVAESNKADMTRVYNRFVLMRSEKILFIGRKGQKSITAMFDMATGDFWRVEKMFRHRMVEETVNSNVVEFSDKQFLISTEGGLYCLNTEDGQTVWRAGIPAYLPPSSPSSGGSNSSTTVSDIVIPPAKIYKHPDKPIVYYLSHMGLMAYDINTGEKLWKKFKKGNGENSLVPDYDHLIVLGERTNGYHYETGEQKWQKPVKIGRRISDFVLLGYMLIYVMETEHAVSKELIYQINTLNLVTGQKVFKKNAKVNGQLTGIWACASGALYQTNKEINIYDVNAGINAIEDPVTVKKRKSGQKLMIIVKGDFAYFFNTRDDYLYSIDLVNRQMKKLTSSPLSFGGKDQNVNEIQMLEDEIFLRSRHNVYLLSTEGEILYHTYYEPISGLKFALYSMGMATVNMAAQIAAEEFADAMNRELNKAKSKYVSKGKSPEQMMARYDAVKDMKVEVETQNFEETDLYKSIGERRDQIISSSSYAVIHGMIRDKGIPIGIINGKYKNDGGDQIPAPGTVILALINKKTGVAEKFYELSGLKQSMMPVFCVDDIASQFYLIRDGKIFCFKY
ncbi:MAG: PQQ-like beta-propeller repeat protein [Bacteroidetes bacterium]|nr:PQQ-like beta-propeller repeat protein [Bacteroidota bacterium]